MVAVVLYHWVYGLIVFGIWAAGFVHGHVLTDELRKRGISWKRTR